MAYDPNELFSAGSDVNSGLRVIPKTVQAKTFAAGSGTLAKLTPVAFNQTTLKWVVWGDTHASKIVRITAAATTATDGTFTLTIGSETTAAIAHDANAAAIKAAIVALTSGVWTTANVTVQDSGSGLGTNDGYATIIFHNQTPDVSITMDLTGDDHTLSTVSSGVGEVVTLTAAATTASDGTYTLTVNGETTGNLNHDDGISTILAALIALGGIGSGDVIGWESAGGLDANAGVCTIAFTGDLLYSNPAVSATYNLTGDDHTLAVAITGIAASGTNVIRGFVWPDAITLVAASEVIGNVLLEGEIHYDDIVLPSGESETVLKAALQSGCRERGLIIQGLASFR